jgi:8-oxo-dGTP pyrophosphatase MutT (NUDIX family)
MTELQSAVVLIIRSNMILTVTNQAHGGIGMPGGKTEPGESHEQTAVRETREEARRLPGFRLEPGHVQETERAP